MMRSDVDHVHRILIRYAVRLSGRTVFFCARDGAPGARRARLTRLAAWRCARAPYASRRRRACATRRSRRACGGSLRTSRSLHRFGRHSCTAMAPPARRGVFRTRVRSRGVRVRAGIRARAGRRMRCRIGRGRRVRRAGGERRAARFRHMAHASPRCATSATGAPVSDTSSCGDRLNTACGWPAAAHRLSRSSRSRSISTTGSTRWPIGHTPPIA